MRRWSGHGWASGWLLAVLCAPPLSAQEPIWRCGHEYTNRPSVQQKATCQAVDWWPVTVHQGPVVHTAPVALAKPAGSNIRPVKRPASAEQQARDAEARLILEAEWRELEKRVQGLRQEYQAAVALAPPANSSPKTRLLQEQLARAEADMAALQRELHRLTPVSPSSK